MPNDRVVIGPRKLTNVDQLLAEPMRMRGNAARAIQSKFESLGGAPGAPVLAADADGLVAVPNGFFRAFQDGRIYTRNVRQPTAPSGPLSASRISFFRQDAFWVHGAILGKYLELGGSDGWLGWPTSDELTTASGPGRFTRFQKGTIYWGPTTGAHVVYGAIRDKWVNLGAERGLGLPTSDEEDVPGQPGARQSRFEGGLITWSPWSGARVTRLFGVPPEAHGAGIKLHTQGSGGQPVAGPQVSRHIVVTAVISLTDDEFWADDEHGHAERRDEQWVDSWDPQGVLQLVGKAGGELRVELNTTAAVRPDGAVRVGIDVRLYEGTSEESTDLDGSRSILELVPPGQNVQVPIRINNDDEGGDFADITLTISNSDT